MLNPANIYRSNRKTLSIFVNPTGELIVQAPQSMSDRKIFDFIKERADWIRERTEAISKNSFIDKNAASYNVFLYLGKQLVPVINDKVKNITQHMGALLVPAKFPPEVILKKVEKYLRDSAKMVITERCAYFSQNLKLSASQICTNNNKTRWGVCSKSREIAVNWRAIMLRPELLDYIIVHEFCHLLEFNHTKNFWAVVETILPNWRKLRLELKKMSWLLQLFR